MGTIVTVFGNGYASTEAVMITFGTRISISQCITSGAGNFATTFTVDTQSYGTKTISAYGLTSGVVARNIFFVRENIILVIPTMGTVGSIVTVRGNGFGATEAIQIDFGTTSNIRQVSSYAYGSWTTCFTINTQPFGTRTISVLGLATGAYTEAFFFIMPKIVCVTPTLGTVGSIVAINGNGFGYYDNIRIDFGTTQSIQTTAAHSTGSFSTYFTINTQPYGATTISVFGLKTCARVESTFNILPNIILVSPWMGTVGTAVTVMGNGYAASEMVIMSFGTTPSITAVNTTAYGNFATTFTVDTQSYGTKTISAAGLASGVVDCDIFFVRANIIFVTPTMGTIGSFVTIRGNGFGGPETVQIDFGTTANIQQISSTVYGSFTTCFTINTQPCGITTIVARGVNSGGWAYANFNVRSNVIFISPVMGTVGTSVRIMGNGFGASEGIIISFGTTPSLSASVSDAHGNLDTTFHVDTQPYGTTTIKVVGLQTQVQTMNCFFIVPNIVFVAPTEGTVGSFVTIAGNGFGANEVMRIDFGTTVNVCNIFSNQQGTFSALFTVDTQPYGMTTILARGFVSNALALSRFTIQPKIVITPTSGQIGSIVTVTGNGFGALEAIRIAFGNTPTITFTTSTWSGVFQTVFTINTQSMGTMTVVASGLCTASQAMAYFVILPATILKITPAAGNVAVGATFTAQVEIINVQQLTTAGTYLSFNPSILEVLEVGTGTFLPDGMIMSKKYDNDTGQINYSVGLLTGSATGSGILFTIKFRAKAGGTSSVVFDSDVSHNRDTVLINVNSQEIPFTKQEAIYQVITGIEVYPKGTETSAGKTIVYTCLAICGSLQVDVTGSTTFTANSGGSFTTNSFLAKYIGTYTIQGTYLGLMGTTAVIIFPGTPTTLSPVSGNGQVGTCPLPLKEPFVVKVTDSFGNPCNGVGVNWQIISSPSGATGQLVSPTNTTTNIYGTASSLLTLGTVPPGTYTIYAISNGLNGSPCTFTARSLRQFGNIAGICFLNLGTETLGTTSDITVGIVQLGTTTTTNDSSYFVFQNIPVGTYTLTFDTWGASPATKTNVSISPTQIEDTTDIGTMTLLAGDVNNDGQVNIGDWDGFRTAFGDYEGNPGGNWQQNKEGDFNHNRQVNEWDFMIFSKNFGQQQQQPYGMPRLVPGQAKTKAIAKKTTSEKIKLTYNLKADEGVNLDDLRIGDKIELEINISEAEKYLGGEVHLSFNPRVLRVVEIQPGDFPRLTGTLSAVIMNKADNSTGKIDYAVVVGEPEERSGGLFATVKFMVIACGNSSEVGFNFDTEENRETMFVEKHNPEEKAEEVNVESPEPLIIKIPLVFNNLDSALVYPNPAHKGDTVKIGNLINDKLISLKIFNIAGELVYEDEQTSVLNTITWGLKNKDNEYVASGIYIYLLECEGLTKKGKIGVIK